MPRCRAMKDFVLKHEVFPKNLRRFRRVWFFLLRQRYLSMSRREASNAVLIWRRIKKFRSIDSGMMEFLLCKQFEGKFSIWGHWFIEWSPIIRRIELWTRLSNTLNLMPFSNRESDSSLSSYRRFNLGRSNFSGKSPLLRTWPVFSLLMSISFYVSSRRISVDVKTGRNPRIAIVAIKHENNFEM